MQILQAKYKYNQIVMRRLLYLGILLIVACTTPNYPGVDNPTQGGKYDNNIVAYIDERLTNEYYWLDEVKQKSSTFNRTLPWVLQQPGTTCLLLLHKGYI